MKMIGKILLAILIVGFIAEESTVVSTPITQQTNTELTSAQKVSDSGSNAVVPAVEKKDLPESVIPAGIVFTSTAFLAANQHLTSILAAVSNAVLTVDDILKTENYKVNSFGGSKWLVAEDKEHSTVWTISPYFTNALVGSIEAIVYQDTEMTQKDNTKSFHMSFYPEVATLHNFSWRDKHEVLFVKTNGACDYGRSAGGNMGLTMRWDSNGKLIFSNLYDRTKLGKPIGGPPPKALPSRPPWPTSSVEAATESWRQKQK